jgi:hypothetical protein
LELETDSTSNFLFAFVLVFLVELILNSSIGFNPSSISREYHRDRSLILPGTEGKEDEELGDGDNPNFRGGLQLLIQIQIIIYLTTSFSTGLPFFLLGEGVFFDFLNGDLEVIPK